MDDVEIFLLVDGDVVRGLPRILVRETRPIVNGFVLVLTFADDGALCLGGDAVREGKGTSRQQGRFA